MAGSIPASAAMARIVARSYPSLANRSRAAVRMAARVASERRGRGSRVTSTTVGQHALTCELAVSYRWSTPVDKGGAMRAHRNVVIVGAGPAGLLLAGDLAAAG